MGEMVCGDMLKTFYYFPDDPENHRVRRENNNALCSLCTLWLIFFAMIHLSGINQKVTEITGIPHICYYIFKRIDAAGFRIRQRAVGYVTASLSVSHRTSRMPK